MNPIVCPAALAYFLVACVGERYNVIYVYRWARARPKLTVACGTCARLRSFRGVHKAGQECSERFTTCAASPGTVRIVLVGQPADVHCVVRVLCLCPTGHSTRALGGCGRRCVLKSVDTPIKQGGDGRGRRSKGAGQGRWGLCSICQTHKKIVVKLGDLRMWPISSPSPCRCSGLQPDHGCNLHHAGELCIALHCVALRCLAACCGTAARSRGASHAGATPQPAPSAAPSRLLLLLPLPPAPRPLLPCPTTMQTTLPVPLPRDRARPNPQLAMFGLLAIKKFAATFLLVPLIIGVLLSHLSTLTLYSRPW